MPIGKLEGVRFSLNGGNRVVEIATDEVVNLFPGVAIYASDIAANEFGIWSLASVGNRGEIKYSSFTQPKHILQARNGCVWNPKMKMTQVGGKLILSPYTVNGEICPDAFWDGAFERIFGTGLEIRNLYGTPDGKAVMDLIMTKIFLAIHNGVYDAMYYGDHPLIASSDTNGYYTAGADEWADYMDQMDVSEGGGVLTQLDGLRDAGEAHLAGAIVGGDISDDEYVGGTNNITYYFDQLYKIATNDLKTVKDSNPGDFVILAHPAEFAAYEDYLTATYNTIPANYQYFLTGSEGVLSPNVLMYKGSPVVRMQGWKRFDTITGYNVHRLCAVARGVMGAAYDVANLPSAGAGEIGMRIDQRFGGGEGHMGKVYMMTDFKLGTEILDHNLVSMYTVVDTP